jgi:hypothetical protein
MLVGESVVDEIAEMIVGAAHTLGAVAIEIGTRAGDCGNELVNVTSRVEWRAFRTYENAGPVSGKPPPIRFETEVIEDAQGNLEPFGVAGSADITIRPGSSDSPSKTAISLLGTYATPPMFCFTNFFSHWRCHPAQRTARSAIGSTGGWTGSPL